VRIRNGNTNAKTVAVWGWMVEAGGFHSSYIRTAGAAATRAEDKVALAAGSWGPYATGDGPIVVDVWPNFSSSESSSLSTIINCGDFYLYIFDDKIQTYTPSLQSQLTGLVWSRHQKLTITTDPDTTLVRVEGATSGDGESSTGTTSASIDSVSDVLNVGHKPGSSRNFDGVVSRLRTG